MTILRRIAGLVPEILEVDSDPSGVTTAPVGSLALLNVAPGTLWRNTTGGTTWVVVGTGAAAKDGVYAGGRIVYVDPAHPQAADDGDVTTPFVTIAAALVAAGLVATLATPRTVLVAPGTYTENLSLPRYVFLVGAPGGDSSGDRTPVHPVTIVGTITADLATVTSLDDTFAGLADLQVAPGVGNRALYVTGFGAFRLVASRCGFLGNAGAPVVEHDNSGVASLRATELALQDCAVTGSSASAVPLVVSDGYVLVRGGTLRAFLGTDALDQSGGTVELRSGCTIIGRADVAAGFYIAEDEAILTTDAVGAILNLGASAFGYLLSCAVSAGASPSITGTGSLFYGHVEYVTGFTGIDSTITKFPFGPQLLSALGLGYAEAPVERVLASKGSPDYPGTEVYTFDRRATTTDATPTSIDLIEAGGGWPVADETSLMVEILVTARVRIGTANRFSAVQHALIYRDGAGAVLGAGSPSQPFRDPTTGVFAATAEIGVAGTTATVTVTGLAATTIDWTVAVRLLAAGAA